MAAADNQLGKGVCPCCGSKNADVRISASQLAYIHCNACNMQMFARSGKSDEKIRDMILKPGDTDSAAPFGDQPDAVAKPAKKIEAPPPPPPPAAKKKNPFMLSFGSE